MTYVTVAPDISRALAKFNMTRDESRRAITRALNHTAAKAKTQAARDIKAVGYGVKVSLIKEGLSIKRARDDTLSAAVRAVGRPLPLIKYNARQTSKGVTADVLNGRKLHPGAFIATMKSGHVGVFVRKGGMQQGKRGKPILNRSLAHELFGPAIPGMFVNDTVQRALADAVRIGFSERLEHELSRMRQLGK